jgi:hypothetical protein
MIKLSLYGNKLSGKSNKGHRFGLSAHSHFIPKAKLLKMVNHKKQLILHAKLIVKYKYCDANQELDVKSAQQFNEMNKLFEDSTLKKFISHSDSLQVNKRMFEERKHCDVEIEVKGEKINAHRAVLAANSPVFAAMFEHELMVENQKKLVEIKDIDFSVFNEMMRFMYYKRVENMKVVAQDLLVAADKYDLEELKLVCQEYLLHDLSVDNSIGLLCLSDKYNAKGMKRKLCDFINENKKVVCDGEEWEEMKRKAPKLAYDVFESTFKEI